MKSKLRFGGILDRYVARLFALSYLTAFCLVVGLYTILDMAINLDEYLEPGPDGEAATLLDVARFYGMQLPFLYLSMSPFVTLVGGLFTGAKLAKHNEIVSALGAGVSSRRLLAPVFLGAAVLSLGMFGLRELLTEEIGAARDALQDRLLENRPAPVYENFFVSDRRGRPVRLRSYVPAVDEGGSPRIRGLSCGYREDDKTIHLEGQFLIWTGRAWGVDGGTRLETDQDGKHLTRFEVLEDLEFEPSDVELFWKGRERPMELSFSECLTLLERDPTNYSYRTLLHYHLTFPLAGLVLLLVGLPFVVSPGRGGAVERVALGMVLCVVYFGADFVCRTLGVQGHLGPLHAGWLPILFFGSLGLTMLGTMRT